MNASVGPGQAPTTHHSPSCGGSRRPCGGPALLDRRVVLGGISAAAALAVIGCSQDSSSSEAGATGSDSAQSTDAAQDSALKVTSDHRYEVAEAVNLSYGKDPARQYGELRVPTGLPEDIKVPVVMIMHGGSWKASSTLNYMREMARHVASYGVVTWNVEYRGIGGGGGWTNTFEDVAKAMDFVPGLDEHIGRSVDHERFVLAGHSAGAHLAAWAASRHVDVEDQPGGKPALKPKACVCFAGIFDLAYAQQRGHRRMTDLLGGTPSQVPEVYELASPIRNIPDDVHFVCCHAQDDTVVPPEQTHRFIATSKEMGNEAEGVILLEGGHSEWMSPQKYAWMVGQERLLATITDD